MKERLDKFISSQTALSRKEAQKAIRDKRVTVNGELSRSVDIKIDTEADAVALNGPARAQAQRTLPRGQTRQGYDGSADPDR